MQKSVLKQKGRCQAVLNQTRTNDSRFLEDILIVNKDIIKTRLELVNLIQINEGDNFRNEVIVFFYIQNYRKEETK